jgi:hypothetical protein
MHPDNSQEHPLSGTKAKVDRARKHGIEFYNAVQGFLNNGPFTFTNSPDLSGRRIVSIASIKPVPIEFSLIIGDAIHNLRSALDLLVCQLFCLANPEDKDFSNLEFPIKNTFKLYGEALSNTKTKFRLIGPQALSIFEKLEPYKLGSDHDLWLIHRLDIQDKHRILILGRLSIHRWRSKATFIPDPPEAGETQVFEAQARVPDDRVFIPKIGNPIVAVEPSVFADGLAGNMNFGFTFEGDIGLDEGEIIQSQSAFETLRRLIQSVDHTIEKFEELF